MEDTDSNNGEFPPLFHTVCQGWHSLRLLE